MSKLYSMYNVLKKLWKIIEVTNNYELTWQYVMIHEVGPYRVNPYLDGMESFLCIQAS